jgi:hypothetical protein
MKKFNLPLTYLPKIQPVIDGKCRQTIRTGRKFSEGDLVSFHGWAGRPYHSSWSFRTPYQSLIEVINIKIVPLGIIFEKAGLVPWMFTYMDTLAKQDGIVPATGEELHKVLMSKNKIPTEGIEGQIIRW